MLTTKSLPSALRELLASKAYGPVLAFDGINQWVVLPGTYSPPSGFHEVLDRPALVDYLDGARYHPAAALWVSQNARQWYLDAEPSES